MSAMEIEKLSERLMGEIVATRIISDWKGTFIADACVAATQIGLLQSGNMLAIDRAKNILRLNFEAKEIDDIHWSTFYDAFQNGRSTVVSNIELRKRYLPAPNDNHRFQVTWFDDVGQTVTKDELILSQSSGPLCGQQQTSSDRPGMSQTCQYATSRAITHPK